MWRLAHVLRPLLVQGAVLAPPKSAAAAGAAAVARKRPRNEQQQQQQRRRTPFVSTLEAIIGSNQDGAASLACRFHRSWPVAR